MEVWGSEVAVYDVENYRNRPNANIAIMKNVFRVITASEDYKREILLE